MPSKWKYFCCTCDKGDTHEYKKPYTRVKVKRRGKNTPGKNATWTRRSLLENEYSDLQMTPFDSIANQMQSDGQYVPGSHEYSVTELETFDDLDKHKRRTAREVFENATPQKTTETTFPWMNEEFVPNGRTGTHLGISSVQINAKRNEQANKNISSDLKDISGRNRLSNHAYLKSQSFNDGVSRDNLVYAKPKIRTNVALNNNRPISNGHNSNVRTVPNGYGFRGNVTTAENKANTVAVPAGRSERPLLLHAPNSDVGVRVVQANSRATGNGIPKLGEYLVRKGGHAAVPISYKPLAENQSDVSFSSEITFRKSEPGNIASEIDLKRSKQPAIFSNSHKYQRLKPSTDTHVPYSVKEAHGPKINLDSMYGYVPKAVQNVHASNALSGGKIDDFLMQRMGEKELEKFASIDRTETKDWRDVMHASYIGTQIAPLRPKSVPVFVTDGKRETEGRSEADKSDYANIRIGLQQIKLQPPPNIKVRNNRMSKQIEGRQPSRGSNYVNTEVRHGGVLRDTNENKVIMIDFPPNPERDQHINTTQVKPNTGHGSEESDFNEAKDKLMVNPFNESEEVLY